MAPSALPPCALTLRGPEFAAARVNGWIRTGSTLLRPLDILHTSTMMMALQQLQMHGCNVVLLPFKPRVRRTNTPAVLLFTQVQTLVCFEQTRNTKSVCSMEKLAVLCQSCMDSLRAANRLLLFLLLLLLLPLLCQLVAEMRFHFSSCIALPQQPFKD